MASYCKLTFRGRNRNNREVVITKGRCSRCPARLTLPRYTALYRTRLRPSEITITIKNMLRKKSVATTCVNDMIFVYRRNYDKIRKALQADLRNHIDNLGNVNKIYGRLAALTIQSEDIVLEIRRLAQEHGADSPEVSEAYTRYNDVRARIRQVTTDTEMVGREFGQGLEIAQSIRTRIRQAVTQAQTISVFYEEVLGICRRTLDTEKVDEKKQQQYLTILAEVRFDELSVQRDFINTVIYEEEIDIAIQHFEIALRDGLFYGTVAPRAEETESTEIAEEIETTE